MHAVDTNVLVRLLVIDNPAQCERAQALFRRESIWISLSVVLETEWVLRASYGHGPHEIHAAFTRLAGLENVSIENAQAFTKALAYSRAGMDFTDALHVAGIGAADNFHTFDVALVTQAAKLGLTHIRKL